MVVEPTPVVSGTAPPVDRRWRLVEATMRRHGRRPDSLIETLHTVQTTYGYIDRKVLRRVAEALGVPLSQAFGVATFYHFFTLEPPGEHNCVVCMGTACYIKGAPGILTALEQRLGVRAGATTADGSVSLLAARCVGSCGLAPAVVFDGQVVGKLDEAGTLARIESWHDSREEGA